MSAYLVQNTLQYNLHNIPVKHHDIRTSAYFSYSFMFIPCLNGLLMDFLSNVYPNYWIIGFLLTGRRHSWAVADRDLLPAVFLNLGPSREASGSFWSSWCFPRKRKKWGEISSKSEQTWFFCGFSFAELLYVLEIQTNIEWITNKKPAGSHEYAWLRIDESESALESHHHHHHHHHKITIKSPYYNDCISYHHVCMMSNFPILILSYVCG
jgi:hypothetical protein